MADSDFDVKILVVDDVPSKLVALESILDEPGQTVVGVSSGREALRRLLHEHFAVVLLDVNMPDIDGFETAALIRERKSTESTPIIFITADSDETHARRGYSLGAVDYILAPVIPEVLRAKVGVFVDLYRKNAQLKQQMNAQIALAQEQAARVAAEDSKRRSEFLADASQVLMHTLDVETRMDSLLRMLVPQIADLASFSQVDQQAGPLLHKLIWHEGQDVQLGAFEQERLPAGLATAIGSAAATGCTTLVKEANLSALTAAADSGAAYARMQLQAVPLVARGHTIGVLTLASDLARRSVLPDISLIKDICSRAAIALDNARLYREIQDGNRRKDEFLAMLGHELRNPLAAMSNALECLEYLRDDPTSCQAANDVLSRQLSHMSRLVDDLLDVSRITCGKVVLRKDVVELSAAAAGAIAAVRPALEGRGHSLSVLLPKEPVYLYADPTRFEQILVNLLHNAVKYTDPGGRIQLRGEVEFGQLAIHVQDNGVGMSPELVAQVFDLFVQGNRSLDRSQGGLGIGLTLVRSLVELHGGRVSAASAGPRQGSVFTVHLPVHVPSSAIKPAEAAPLANMVSRRILLIDDNVDLAETTAALLRAAGHEVRIAHEGHKGLSDAVEYQPDTMLIDIGLPGLNGYEVARRLRQTAGFESALLVALTGYGQEDDRNQSLEAGFDRHLVKPIGFRELQEALVVRTAPEPSEVPT